MVFGGDEVPQANSLWDFVSLVVAVNLGADGDDELGAAIGKSSRQGRYYRRAAESLGLLHPVAHGHSELTSEGKNLAVADNQNARRAILVSAVLGNPLIREILSYIEDGGEHGRSNAELTSWIVDNTALTGTTPGRRVSTTKKWLLELGLVESLAGGGLRTAPFDTESIEQRPDHVSVLTPGRRALMPFSGEPPEPRADVPPSLIAHWVDHSKLERANHVHEHLVARTAQLARNAGHDVSMNQYVDLFAAGPSGSYLFEMKTNDAANTLSQVRKAVAQLYEYQYQQSLTESRLVLVLENEPPENLSWTVGYLSDARGILPVWQETSAFTGPAASRARLPWLMA